MKQKSEAGQALVLVLLSLSVVLTLILFILSRSITDVAVSSRQDEAVRAFSAAEAGVERALVTGSNYSAESLGNASYTTSVTEFALDSNDLVYPSAVSSGETVTVWFTSHKTDGSMSCDSPLPCYAGPQMKVCWGNPGTVANSAVTPAVEVTVYYEVTPGDLSTLRIGRTTADPNAGRTGTNSFSGVDGVTCQVGSQTYAFQKTITFADLGIPASSYGSDNGLQLAQIRMLYNDISHNVGINVTGDTLPSQGKAIDSSGTVTGGSNRRIIVHQGWPEFPFVSNSMISPVGITK